MKYLSRVIAVLTAITVAGCAGTPVYSPTDSGPQTPMTVSQAKKRIKELVQIQEGSALGIWKVADVQFRSDGVLVISKNVDSQAEMRAFYPNQTPQIQVLKNSSVFYLNCDDCDGNWRFWTGSSARTSAIDFADALYALKNGAVDSQDLKAFHVVALQYRTKSPKPAIPEETRKFQIQAESAVNARRYEDAADLYEQALQTSAWWPEGHYNRALMLAQLSKFDDAIIEMKKYLDLVPNASDARKSQDKIYEWEGKAGATQK